MNLSKPTPSLARGRAYEEEEGPSIRVVCRLVGGVSRLGHSRQKNVGVHIILPQLQPSLTVCTCTCITRKTPGKSWRHFTVVKTAEKSFSPSTQVCKISLL